MSPYAAPSLCSRPGCGKIGKHSHREYDQQRGTAASRGYDARHRRWRKMILARDPICVMCRATGMAVVATVADHIIPLRQGGGWELENGRGLCHSHHNQVTAKGNAT